MFFSGKSKRFPELSEFLERKMHERRNSGSRVGIVGGIVGMLGGLTGGLIGILAGFGLIHFTAGAIAATVVGLNLACWLIILGYFYFDRQRQLAKNNRAERKHHAEALEVVNVLHGSLNRRKLHRELDSAACMLLEECTRHYNRIVAALSAPFWNSEQLPAHWRNVKEQSMLAADQAMDEVLVMLRSCYNPNVKQGWEDVVEDVLDNFRVDRSQKLEPLPATYDPARELGEKLKLLASEVENATREVAQDEAISDDFTAGSALDMVMNDLKTIRHAEEELRQNLRQGLD